MTKAKTKRKTAELRYYTHAHNIEGCLRNGSFVRQYPDGVLVQYMNGDNMGIIGEVPKTMKEVPVDLALELMPDCCK